MEYKVRGGEGAHWEDCWKSHYDCADRLIERLLGEVESLRARVRELEQMAEQASVSQAQADAWQEWFRRCVAARVVGRPEPDIRGMDLYG